MMGITHKTVGVISGCTLAACFIIAGQPTLAVSGLLVPVGAMLPDIDHDSTKVGRVRKKAVNTLTRGIQVGASILVGVTFVLLTRMLVLSVGAGLLVLLLLCSSKGKKKKGNVLTIHRGITHTLVIPVIMVFCIVFVKSVFLRVMLIGLLCGWLSHLLCDSLTVQGCPLLYPFIKENISFARIKTGTKQEKIAAFMVCVMTGFIQYIVLLK